ncbi:hypothetical protein [Haloferax sp. KTX1]|uniref:hypothetical protein n=1 Tax=Haloferax sp. KTX1 TaxID=2600597 RepID=UPI0016523BDA|nr:hypothetical protein [Haloferax sp. KTX1]
MVKHKIIQPGKTKRGKHPNLSKKIRMAEEQGYSVVTTVSVKGTTTEIIMVKDDE